MRVWPPFGVPVELPEPRLRGRRAQRDMREAPGRRTPAPAVVRRRRRGGRAVAVSCMVMLTAMVGGASWAMMGRPACAASELSVVADPQIAPVLRQLGGIAGGCAVAVVARSSAEVADALARGEAAPDVWVPEDSVWPGLAVERGAPRRLAGAAPSIARTPVILAVRQEMATKIAVKGARPTWNVLAPSDQVVTENKLTVMLADPAVSAAGIAAVDVFAAAMGDRDDFAQVMAEVLPDLRRSVLSGPADLLAALDPDDAADADDTDAAADTDADGDEPMVVVPEQALFAHNTAGPRRTAIGLYPPEGAVALDYPYVVSAEDPAKREAAAAFLEVIRSERGAAAVRAAGFRTPDGRADARMSDQYGLRAEEPARIPDPPAEVTAQALRGLRLLLAPTRTVVLVDTSWSMRQKVRGTADTRLSLAARLAEEGVRGLPEGSEAGAWRFATDVDGDRDYQEVVPVGPAGERAERIGDELRGLRKKIGGHTGLYDAVLAAVEEAGRRDDPAQVGMVIVVTDGRNDLGEKGEKGGNGERGTSLDDAVRALREGYDAERPVTVAALGFGPDVDRAELEAIAGATNGRAVVAGTADEARTALLDLFARPACLTACPS
ncbi:Mg-chelatase subunit ChlD [Thermocatellispora tengchongensis]|uniref:Mg-chelatase subunit ChlD n=1 Tax=Thermocatellispora tengchongensis TaxID=1073253 RepID=A0A840P029_9ACTN|nr:substrate-binding domain-containing protein [Thermocatellispora tengchongensis]MBB5132752.1 Mg-chelatase subunit ChlD [Thermocatellispora tengchongensis]